MGEEGTGKPSVCGGGEGKGERDGRRVNVGGRVGCEEGGDEEL